MIAVRRLSPLEALAAVKAPEPSFVADENAVGVVGIYAERRVIKWPGDEVARAVHERPGGARVLGPVESRSRLGLDQRINAIRHRRRNGHVRAPEQLIGQTAPEF